MANYSQLVTVLQYPDLTIPTAPVQIAIQNMDIDSATAPSAKQLVQFPTAIIQVSSRYFRNNQQLTGTYIISTVGTTTSSSAAALAALVTAGNGILQAVHLVQLTNGSAAAGSGGAGTLYVLNNLQFDELAPATAKQIVTYPNALTQIKKRYYSNAAQFTGAAICTESLATVQAAS